MVLRLTKSIICYLKFIKRLLVKFIFLKKDNPFLCRIEAYKREGFIMNLVVHFKDGKHIIMEDWGKWSKDLDGHKDIIELFLHYKKVNQELTFSDSRTGITEKRFAEDVRSIEITF